MKQNRHFRQIVMTLMTIVHVVRSVVWVIEDKIVLAGI